MPMQKTLNGNDEDDEINNGSTTTNHFHFQQRSWTNDSKLGILTGAQTKKKISSVLALLFDSSITVCMTER